MSGSDFAFGRPKWAWVATAAAQSSLAGSRAALGGLLEAGVRYRWRRWPQPDQSFLNNQLGETVELTLRLRRFYPLAATTPPVWMAGFAPGVASRPAYEHFTSVTLLGILIPEVGIVAGAGHSRSYVGWSLPMEWRWVRAGEPQHPYEWKDRMAIEVTPFAQRVLGSWPYHWLEGVSVGVTAW